LLTCAFAVQMLGVILVSNKFKLIKMEVQIYLAFHWRRSSTLIHAIPQRCKWRLTYSSSLGRRFWPDLKSLFPYKGILSQTHLFHMASCPRAAPLPCGM